jgi:myosin heavy subunit
MEGRRADILQLADSSEDAVLHAIHRWFLADQIYSSLGPVLVAVNPCRQLASLYSESTLRAHLEGASSSASAPHIYALAARVYRGVLDGRSHSVVISGESGAGKTESFKRLLEAISTAAQRGRCDWRRDPRAHAPCQLEQLVLRTAPILESFGNAATIHNHDSSRVGKRAEHGIP